MEQLTEIQVLLKKVEFDVSMPQLRTLSFLVQGFLLRKNGLKLNIVEKVLHYMIYEIYEKKIRPNEIKQKAKVKIKLNIAQAQALKSAFGYLNVEHMPYENTLVDYITGEIHRQTI